VIKISARISKTPCIWGVNFNQWKNSPIYETFVNNILQNSQKFSNIFLYFISLFFCNHENFIFSYLIFSITM
jgi:hypothetical protein